VNWWCGFASNLLPGATPRLNRLDGRLFKDVVGMNKLKLVSKY